MAIRPPINYTAIIADDHEIVRSGLKAALQTKDLIETEGISVVAEAANGFDTLASIKKFRPDLLLLDINMPLSNGYEILTDVRRWSPETKIVIFSSVETPSVLAQLVRDGVDGMFYKGGSNKALYEQLPLILRGGRHIAPECLERIQHAQHTLELTPRESQTLQMLLTGRTTKEIASAQGISPRTAEKHRASVMNKIGAKSLPELMQKALQQGLIEST